MTKGKGYLVPLNETPKTYRVIGFDVEGTGDEDGFLLGVIYDEVGWRVFRDRESMCKALIAHRYRGCRLYAHNLEYDFGCLFQDDLEGWSVYRLHSRLIKCVFRDGQKSVWHFHDTGNLSYFISLSAIGKILGMQKLETPDWIKADGSSDLDKGKITSEQWRDLETYCVRDAMICYKYAVHIQETINVLGGELKTTLPATGMDLFRRRYLNHPVKTPHPATNMLSREGYYGGRCEVFRYGTGHELYQYDIHSMYPSAILTTELPDPAGLYFFGTVKRESHILNREGITKCRIRAPLMHVPILPVRINGRLVFPTGDFDGAWCHNELRYALDRGYDILSIDWQLCTLETCNPLRQYVRDLYDRKVAAQRSGDPSFFIYKLLLNSIYGKFGQKSGDSFTKMVRIDLIDDFLEKVGIDIIEWQGESYVVSPVCGKRQPAYVIVLWAAYITAEARIKEYELMQRFDRGLAYCDTDCAIGPASLGTSDHLGGLGLERGPVTFEIRAPKYYRWTANDRDWQYRKAGIRSQFQRDFWETGAVSYYRPTKIGESMKANTRMSRWIVQLKTDRARLFKRCPESEVWQAGGQIETRPWTFDEATFMYENAKPLLPWVGGQMMSESILAEQEAETLETWRIKTEIEALRKGLTIPATVIFTVWDHHRGDWRRVKNSRGQIVDGAHARFDELGSELGYVDERAFREGVRAHVVTYGRIRDLERRVHYRHESDEVLSDELEGIPF